MTCKSIPRHFLIDTWRVIVLTIEYSIRKKNNKKFPNAVIYLIGPPTEEYTCEGDWIIGNDLLQRQSKSTALGHPNGIRRPTFDIPHYILFNFFISGQVIFAQFWMVRTSLLLFGREISPFISPHSIFFDVCAFDMLTGRTNKVLKTSGQQENGKEEKEKR